MTAAPFRPPRKFPPAPEPETLLPMWLFWVYVAVLAGLTGYAIWVTLS